MVKDVADGGLEGSGCVDGREEDGRSGVGEVAYLEAELGELKVIFAGV